MELDRRASTEMSAPPVESRGGALLEIDELRATCRYQSEAIAALSDAVDNMRRALNALTAENAGLRESSPRERSPRGDADRGGVDATEVRLPLDEQAPSGARRAIADALEARVAPGVLDDALLLVTELVTNSVRHSGMPARSGVVVTVALTRSGVYLDVEDAGRGGTIAPRPGDCMTGGYGLNLVQS